METVVNLYPKKVSITRKQVARLVFLFVFISLVYSYFSNTLVHQLRTPVLKFPYVDLTYWVMHFLGIPDYITGHPLLAWCFDLLMFVTCALAFMFPLKRVLSVIFFILYFNYFIIYNSYGTHHTHSKVGILLICIPFMFRRMEAFEFIWEGLRYFTLFIYADAFTWKLIRFTWLHSMQGELIVKENLAPYLYYHPGTRLAKLYYWMLENGVVLNILFKLGFVLEGLFIIGFFTRKVDHYLLAASVLLSVGFIFVSDAFFFELLILSLTLIPFQWRRDAVSLPVR